MKKNVLLVLLLIFFAAGEVWAQQRTIKGRVMESSTDQPLVGATIVLTGTQTGAITDSRGRFSIIVPEDAKSMTVSTVGYETITVPLTSSDTYTVNMKTTENSLKQLVVVGYGEQRKADLTGAVATVNVQRTFDSKPLIDVTKALQGIVPGLTITYPDGGLTTAPGITLRGIGSVNGSSQPLILVDNVPTPDLSVIDPNDIASITVLKDAASAAIYGARAAFGVILIKTKYGHHNQPTRISYTSNYSWNTPTVLPDFANPVQGLGALLKGSVRAGNSTPDEFGMELTKLISGIQNWEQQYAGKRKGIAMVPGEDFEFGNATEPTYFYRVWDVKKLMIKKWTPQQTQNLSVSGGTDKVSYYMSAGYAHEGGIMKMNPDDVKKYNLTASVDVEATKWLDLSSKIYYRNFVYAYPFPYQAYWYYMWRWGSYFPYGTYQGSYFREPTAYLAGAQTCTTTDNYSRTDLGATLRPLPHLTIQAMYSINRDNVIGRVVGGPITAWNWWAGGTTPLQNIASSSQNQVTYSAGRNMVNTFNGFATYDNTFNNDHHLTLMVGMNSENDQNIDFSAEARGLLDPTKGELGLTTGQQYAFGNHGNAAYAGYFGRINYAYKDKYLVELNGRYDGSSAFSPADRWAFFSSGSLGYRISDEPFMQSLKPVVNDLKIRASLGEIGNLDVGGQLYIPTMNPYQANWIVNGQLAQTFTNPIAVSNSVKWERIKTLDFGLDFSLLKNYISGSFDWYQRNNNGMLAGTQVPATFGAAAPRTNQGNMRDRGFELQIFGNYEINKHWKVYAMVSLDNNRAVITQWNNPSKLISEYYAGDVYGSIWGFVTNGFFQSADDVAKSPSQVALQNGNFVYGPGDIKFKDLNHDGKIDAGNSTASNHGDLTVIGNTQPQYLYAGRLGTEWKNFDVDVFIQGVGKRSMWGYGDMVIPYFRGGDITYAHQLDYWTPTHTNAKYPNPYVGNNDGIIVGLQAGGNDFYPQTKYLLNLAYCRLKNVTIGYTLPEALTHKAHLYKFRVYVSGQNLATISHVGIPLDPEITDGALGFTGRTFPFQKNYSFGADITF